VACFVDEGEPVPRVRQARREEGRGAGGGYTDTKGAKVILVVRGLPVRTGPSVGVACFLDEGEPVPRVRRARREEGRGGGGYTNTKGAKVILVVRGLPVRTGPSVGVASLVDEGEPVPRVRRVWRCSARDVTQSTAHVRLVVRDGVSRSGMLAEPGRPNGEVACVRRSTGHTHKHTTRTTHHKTRQEQHDHGSYLCEW